MFSKLFTFLGQNITATAAFVQALLTTLVLFGVKFTPEQIAGLLAVVTSGLALVAIAHRQDPPSKAPPSSPTGIGGAGLLLLALCVFGLTSCASPGHLTPEAKSVVTSVDDVVHRLCLLAHADAVGVSPGELARDVCTAESELAPFRPAVLAAEQAGAAQAGLARQ